MPNARAHAQIGATAGTFTYLGMAAHYKREVKLEEMGLCAALGLVFAALPDLIEPALTPNHRSTAHSGVLLLLLIAFLAWYCRDPDGERHQFVKIAMAAAGAGYTTHLIADGCTPKGLPICG